MHTNNSKSTHNLFTSKQFGLQCNTETFSLQHEWSLTELYAWLYYQQSHSPAVVIESPETIWVLDIIMDPVPWAVFIRVHHKSNIKCWNTLGCLNQHTAPNTKNTEGECPTPQKGECPPPPPNAVECPHKNKIDVECWETLSCPRSINLNINHFTSQLPLCFLVTFVISSKLQCSFHTCILCLYPTLRCDIQGFRAMGLSVQYWPRWFQDFPAIWLVVMPFEANGAHLGICTFPEKNLLYVWNKLFLGDKIIPKENSSCEVFMVTKCRYNKNFVFISSWLTAVKYDSCPMSQVNVVASP